MRIKYLFIMLLISIVIISSNLFAQEIILDNGKLVIPLINNRLNKHGALKILKYITDVYIPKAQYNNGIEASEIINKYYGKELEDDCLLYKGLCHFKLGQYDEFSRSFSYLYDDYPNDDMIKSGKALKTLIKFTKSCHDLKAIIRLNYLLNMYGADKDVFLLLEDKIIHRFMLDRRINTFYIGGNYGHKLKDWRWTYIDSSYATESSNKKVQDVLNYNGRFRKQLDEEISIFLKGKLFERYNSIDYNHKKKYFLKCITIKKYEYGHTKNVVDGQERGLIKYVEFSVKRKDSPMMSDYLKYLGFDLREIAKELLKY